MENMELYNSWNVENKDSSIVIFQNLFLSTYFTHLDKILKVRSSFQKLKHYFQELIQGKKSLCFLCPRSLE